MNTPPRFELKTIGHATLILLEDGVPLIATDPWLLGSAYWRSWWLEKYPAPEEVDLVKRAQAIYITHSHPDHFHWPSLRSLGPRKVLNPRFPYYEIPAFLESQNYPTEILEPFEWRSLSAHVRACSIPVPIDDSILIIETPSAVIVNLNDTSPRRALMEHIRARYIAPGKTVIALKSHSPASAGAMTYKDGKRAPLKSKRDFAKVAQKMAEALGASYFVPFASQVFFNRSDSKWANEVKVIYEDLLENWEDSPVKLCKPFVTMDLETFEHRSGYSGVRRELGEEQLAKVREEEAIESAFRLPADFDQKLKKYLDEVYFIRTLYRKGIGWRLTTSGAERFYDSKTQEISHSIPARHDWVISLPDKVLSDALQNGILTDLGITLFVRVDTQVNIKLTYLAFLLMGLHDYGHFKKWSSFARFSAFYAPYFVPKLWAVLPKGARSKRGEIAPA